MGLKWVEEKYQLSDCLTKKGASPTGRVEDKTLSTLIMTEYGQETCGNGLVKLLFTFYRQTTMHIDTVYSAAYIFVFPYHY